MSSSGNDGAGKYLGNQLASAQIASQIGTQMQSQTFGMAPDTMSAIHKLTGVSSQLQAFRSSMLDKLFPPIQSFNAYNSELLSPALSETYVPRSKVGRWSLSARSPTTTPSTNSGIRLPR